MRMFHNTLPPLLRKVLLLSQKKNVLLGPCRSDLYGIAHYYARVPSLPEHSVGSLLHVTWVLLLSSPLLVPTPAGCVLVSPCTHVH